MTKRKAPTRVGPITPELLPIPTLEQRGGQQYWDMYAMGERGGWTRTPLPDEFWAELHDLLDRFGGIDGDADSRLRAVIVDRTEHEVFHFEPVARIMFENSIEEHLDALSAHMANLKIAQDCVASEVRVIQLLRTMRSTK